MSEEQGYIKLYRSLLDWEWYADNNTKCLFIHLLLISNHKDAFWKGKEIKRGQTFTSIKHLSKALGLSEMMIRISLKKLEKSQNITSKTTNEGSLLSVCNYDTYQGQDLPSNKQHNKRITSHQQANNKPITTNNNDKNDKNENNEKEVGEAKASLVEISTSEVMKSWNDFCFLYGFNPIRFITGKRKTALRERLRDNKAFLADFQKALECILQSDFCRGNNDRQWTADFDWLMRPDTVTKLLEGKYSNNRNNNIQASISISKSLWDDKPTDTEEQREINAKVRAEEAKIKAKKEAYELRQKQFSTN